MIIKETYKLILFPEIQTFMDEDWFLEEAILAESDGNQQWIGDSAYFIPNKRIEEYKLK